MIGGPHCGDAFPVGAAVVVAARRFVLPQAVGPNVLQDDATPRTVTSGRHRYARDPARDLYLHQEAL